MLYDYGIVKEDLVKIASVTTFLILAPLKSDFYSGTFPRVFKL
jgi:hypothetical protein